MSKETPLYVLDANVLLRFITKTPPDQAAKARDLLKRGQAGEVRLVLEPLTLADVVYVLKKPYAMSSFDRHLKRLGVDWLEP